MPYSSIDTDRLSAFHKVIDSGAAAASAGSAGLSSIGSNIGKGVSGALGNRAAKLEAEAKLKSELEDTLDELEYFNRQLIAAGQDNTAIRQRMDRIKQRLSQMGSVDLSAPTPTSPILKQGGMTPGNSGSGMIGA